MAEAAINKGEGGNEGGGDGGNGLKGGAGGEQAAAAGLATGGWGEWQYHLMVDAIVILVHCDSAWVARPTSIHETTSASTPLLLTPHPQPRTRSPRLRAELAITR